MTKGLSEAVQGLRLMQLMIDPDVRIITGIFDTNTLTFSFISDSCINILGYNPSEIINKKLELFIDEDDLEKSIDEARYNKEHDSYPEFFINTYTHKDGRKIPLLWITVGADEEMAICLGIPINVTLIKRINKFINV